METDIRLTLAERDRRYAAIRERLRLRSVDCVIAVGSNLFYLTNGLPGERFGLLPTAEGTFLTAVIHRRYFVDLSPQVLADAQDWVKDLRSGIDATPLVARIRELGIENGTIGVTGARVGHGGLSHGFYEQLATDLPAADIVDVSDVFADVRTLKSEEEIRMIEAANRIFDAAIERVHEVARPGMTGAEVVQEGVKAMWAAGGDTDSTFFFTFGPVPLQNPVLAHLALHRRIQPGDMGTLTAHSEYGHYAGHSDQEISFGKPKALHREMFGGVQHIRDAVLKKVRDGVTQRELIDTYEIACSHTGFNASPHSQIHQYGIDVPEFPGPAFKVADPRGGKNLGGGGNFVLRSGMIYSISPTLVAKNGADTLLGGTSLVVTDEGYRELSAREGRTARVGWLKPGCTVIYNTPEEVDVETARKARIVVGVKEEIVGHLPPYDAIESLLASGDLTEADVSCEITDILLGRRKGRESAEDVIAYLNPGCGIYDTAVASYIHRKAVEQGIGTLLPV